MKVKKIKRWVSDITTFLLIIVIILMLFIVISSKFTGGEPQVFGYQLKTVLSGSMEPTIQTGSIIAVKQVEDMAKLKKGDVITFVTEDRVNVTHRIVDIIKNGELVSYRTKGDNNNSNDPNSVLADNVIAKYSGFTIPYLGYLSEFSKSRTGNLILGLIPGLLLLAYATVTIWKAIFQLNKKSNNPSDSVSLNKQ